MSGENQHADVAGMSFEDALSELERLVRQLEGGDTKLEDAITAYERGVALKSHCEKKLSEAKAKVEKISLGPGGAVSTEPADFD